MSDELIISGGGSVIVATDEFFALMQGLDEAKNDAHWARVRLTTIDAAVTGQALRYADAPASALDAERHIDAALAELGEFERVAHLTSVAIRLSAEAYGMTEQVIDSIIQQLNARLGYSIGLLVPLLVAMSFPVLAGATVSLLAASLLVPGGPRAVVGRLGDWLRTNNELLSNPATVAVIRAIVMSADDALMGATRVPPELAHLLGDEGLGITGLGTTALVAAFAGSRIGVFAETPVAITRTATTSLPMAPDGLADRVARIPDPAKNANGEQIRIDRFTVPGEPDRFEVYIAGTVDFSPVAGDEPFDLTSNLYGIAELPAGSYRGVQAALADAGVTAESPVVFTGHSQGGLVAASLAASGDYNTQGVFTIGAPDGGVVIDADVPVVAIDHLEDLVTVLGGKQLDTGTIVIERHVFAGRQVPDDVLFPAHEREVYQETAALADKAENRQLRDAIARLDLISRGATEMTTNTYLASRVQG